MRRRPTWPGGVGGNACARRRDEGRTVHLALRIARPVRHRDKALRAPGTGQRRHRPAGVRLADARRIARDHHLAPLRVRHADDRHVRKFAARAQRLLDLHRRHFFSTGDDQRVAPAQKVEVTAFVAPPKILGDKLTRLNALVHPRIDVLRKTLMDRYLADPGVKAIIWDTPLLVEVGLDRDCDAVVFVEASDEIRRERVRQSRGWSAAELEKREKSQLGLDKKASIADYYVNNSGDEVASLLQVQRVLSHLFSKTHS